MKKRLLLCLLILIFVCGCSYDSASIYKLSYEDLFFDIKELGTYKDLSMDKVEITITEEEMNTEIEANLMKYSTMEEVKDRGIKKGDIVYLRYAVLDHDRSGDEVDCDMIVGDGDFDPKFEDKLVGKRSGSHDTFTISFDEHCYNDAWKNREITFSVYIYKIEETVFPELTEAFFSENFSFQTVDEYYEYIRKIILNYSRLSI